MSNIIQGNFGGRGQSHTEKKGPSLGDIFNEVLKQSENNKDIIVDPYELKMGGNGRLYIPGTSVDDSLGFELNDWSLGQLASKANIPVRYLRKCPSQLQAVNVNYWLRTAEDNKSDWMLRARQLNKLDPKAGGLVRGIMTEKYSPFDDHEILEIINKILGVKDNSYTINWFHRDDTGFHLRITFEDLTTTIGETIDGSPDIHKVGLHITNSEVGKSSIRITPMVWRLVCTNGLMGWREEGAFSQRHVGLRPQEMYGRVSEAIAGGLKLGAEMVETLRASREFDIEDPFEVIDQISKDFKYSEQLTEKLKESFMEDNSKSAFGVVQAMTRAAQHYDADRRVEIEGDAGKYLNKTIGKLA